MRQSPSIWRKIIRREQKITRQSENKHDEDDEDDEDEEEDTEMLESHQVIEGEEKRLKKPKSRKSELQFVRRPLISWTVKILVIIDS